MPDLEISRLPQLQGGDLQGTDPIAIADLSASETKKLTVTDLLSNGIQFIGDNSIPGDSIISIDGSKIEPNSITSLELAPDSVTDVELADLAVDTGAIQDLAVTNSKLASDIDGSKLLNDSVTSAKILSLDGAKIETDSIDSNAIAPDAIGSSELADGSVDTAAIQDGAVTDSKLAGDIGGDKILNGSITSDKYAPGSVGTDALADGAVTDAKITGPIDGSKLDAASIPATALGAVTDRGLDQATGKIGIGNNVTPGTQGGITWNEQGLITGASAVNPGDLPIATTTELGAVSVPVAGGLGVTAQGAISIANSVAPATVRGIEYDEHGSIVSIDPTIPESAVPIATQTTIGGVKVPGPDLSVSADGSVTISDSAVTPGTYPKVTVNQKGVVTSGTVLNAADIPDIDASKVTTGQFPSARIEDKSIVRSKLANYSISFIQEAIPDADPSVHIGCLWFQESTAGLHMWNGNSWMPVSLGRLSQENLRYCGTIDATTGIITGVTTFGTQAGYTVGDNLAAATDPLTGTYFVVDVPGSGIPQAPGLTFDAGDWVLCNGAAAGYVRIDTLNGGGGGGGGAQRLNDLLDVTVTTPIEGQLLAYGAAGQWVNVSAIDGGVF